MLERRDLTKEISRTQSAEDDRSRSVYVFDYLDTARNDY